MQNCENIAMAWIWATRLSRPVSRMIEFLESEYGDIEIAYDMIKHGELTDNISKNKKTAEKLCDINKFEETENIYHTAINKGMRIVHQRSSIYPKYLKEIKGAPAVLYCYGKLPAEAEEERNECIELLSIVGARNCSAYGYGTALKFSKILSALGIGIVSGMARGIDSAAHKGALESEAYTVAVLGSGADIIYPAENRHLYNEIKKTGCIISEFIPGTEPARNHFPARNRIIAGMSRAVTVIEAGETSGAMITAGLAGEMGRDVYAVPGNIDNNLSVGGNKLIQNGALCVMSHLDILEELGITSCGFDVVKSESRLDFQNPEENAIYNAIKNGCYDLNSIYAETGIPFGKLRSVLCVLEINGMISRNYDGFYYVCNSKL